MKHGWLILGMLWTGTVQAAVSHVWDAEFSPGEKQGLISWIEQVHSGLTRLVGPLPFDIRVHYRRREHRGEPVPWAETNKGRGPAAYFHVDTQYPWTAFRDDWTAAHELTHLLFPYLGEDSRWFAEGIASYMQYQVMAASGVISWPQAMARLQERFERAGQLQRSSRQSIVELSRRPSGRKAYVRYYWGGAAYFMHVDQQLQQEQGMRLTQVIRQYVNCCYRPWGVDADEMMDSLDRVSGSRIFSRVYAEQMLQPGFPETQAPMAWLRQHPPVKLESLDR